jgi:outer membrane protein W
MRIAFTAFLLLASNVVAQRRPIEAGIQHVAGSYGTTRFGSGRVELPMSRGFAATAEVFWTPRVTTHFAATFVNPEAFLYTPAETDLGTVGINVASAVVRYHFRPNARLSGFAGAGAAYASLGNLDDRFGDGVEASLDPQLTWTATAGLRYHVTQRLTLEAGAMYLPLQPKLKVAKTNTPLPRELSLDAVTVSIGATWRF